MKFRTTLLQAGKTATGIRVPDEVMLALASGKKPPVRVTINGHTYRSTVATIDGQPMVGVSAENRAAAGVSGGDQVDVDIELDTALREVDVPAELGKALNGDPTAKRFFDSLSNSQKSWHTLAISGAKTEERRQRRLEKSMQMLREGRKP
jgi:Bacteriocin-protection, YdeI or OmpD-Associated/Domain of unknown function (DUF1905)